MNTENKNKKKFDIKSAAAFLCGKIKTASKTALKNIKSSGNLPILKDKRFKRAFFITAVTASCFCFSAAFLSAGYDVYLNGQHIGVVSEEDDFQKILDEVNDTIVSVTGNTYSRILYMPSYFIKISLKSDISSDDELRSSILQLSDDVCYASTLIADGKAVLSTENGQTARKAVEDVIKSYQSKTARLLTDIKYINEYVPRSDIKTDDNAYLMLREVLQVETSVSVTYNENIPFDTAQQPDDSMYTDEQKVITPGANGTRKIVATVKSINGVESAREIISSTDTLPASSQTVAVGTKERPSKFGTGVMMLPYSGKVSSRFGARDGRATSHKGVDLAGSTGSPVAAADNGTVTAAEFRSDYGNIVIVDHNNGIQTYYAHLSQIDVSVGDVVGKGDCLGLVGSTGNSTGPHLHFEVRRDGVPIDPYSYIN